MPKDFGNKELIWTLTANGKTERAYASLKSDYQIDKQVISTEVGGDFGSLRDELRTNMPPELEVEGRQASEREGGRAADVGGDRQRSRQPAGQTSGRRPSVEPPAATPAAAPTCYRPPSSIIPSSGPGLRLSWIVYRGKAATVTFSPEQMKTWTDTRVYANSPWSPPYLIPEPPGDGKWKVDATFRSRAPTCCVRWRATARCSPMTT